MYIYVCVCVREYCSSTNTITKKKKKEKNSTTFASVSHFILLNKIPLNTFLNIWTIQHTIIQHEPFIYTYIAKTIIFPSNPHPSIHLCIHWLAYLVSKPASQPASHLSQLASHSSFLRLCVHFVSHSFNQSSVIQSYIYECIYLLAYK